MAVIKARHESRNSEYEVSAPDMSIWRAKNFVEVLNEGKPQCYFPNVKFEDEEDNEKTRGIRDVQYVLVDVGCCKVDGTRCYLREGWRLSVLPELYIV